MNLNAKFWMSLATVLTLGLFGLEQPVWAQSNCKQIKADFSGIVPPGPPPIVARGTITNGGDLDGTITLVDTVSFGSPTPDPMVVSFTEDIVITTHEGQLTATSVQLFDFANLLDPSNPHPFGLDTGIQRIGPINNHVFPNATSTGKFAGAKGFYFLSGVATPDGQGGFIVQGQITGQICLRTAKLPAVTHRVDPPGTLSPSF